MGQINSALGSENISQIGPVSQDDAEKSKLEKEQQKEANSEQVRCVKTRIDMLIEDCLNTKDSNSEAENGRNERKDVFNMLHMSENIKRKEKITERRDSDTGTTETKGEASSTVDIPKGDRNERVELKVKPEEKVDETGDKKEGKKEEILLSDIITDMVNTELTEKQLKHIQQRTITTFNTFIDKVLDNSLNQENCEEEKPKPTNILQLCTESMISEKERKGEDNTNDSDRNEDRNEKPECDRDVVKSKPEKKITLKDHIERFLELSFRDEENAEKKSKKSESNLQENFNAQGLVNSMITHGVQINRLLTSKEQQNSATPNLQKELETQKKQLKYPELNLKPKKQETYGQKSPNLNTSNVPERTEARYNHAIAAKQMADTKLRDQYFSRGKYEPNNRNSQIPHPYARADEIQERSREIQMKMSSGSKHDIGVVNNMRAADNSSAFHHPHYLHVPNTFMNQQFIPRMQMSPGQMRDIRGDNKQVVHVRDCMCAMCVQQAHSRHGKMDSSVMDYHLGKRSPNVPHQLLASGMTVQTVPGHVRDVPAMIQPSHAEIASGMVAYQSFHKMMPNQPPIASSKVYNSGQMLVPNEIHAQGMLPSRQTNIPETQHYLNPYQQRRGDEYKNNSPNNERLALRSGKQSPYYRRPPSLPPNEHNGPHYSKPSSRQRVFESDLSRNTDSSSCASDCSNEAPLDLTVKKPKMESTHTRSPCNPGTVCRINPSNTFIKHLECSVDKYWQELNSPPASPVNTKPSTPISRGLSPNDSRNLHYGSQQQTSNAVSPPGMLSMLQNRPLPSPHYSGGITVGQPLVDMKPPAAVKQTEFSHQTGTQMLNKQSLSQNQQSQFQGNQANFESNSKRSANNVSKHEPIQNIIGNHDPNDILYLICRLCTQTYGSPYGFRKHFRNQHGFEPRAEHTIVQTISATKTALHLPQPPLMQGMSEMHESHMLRKSISPEREVFNQKCATITYSERNCNSESPVDSKSVTGSEEGDKSELENTETKFLECPECGKTFQLNDFGSYKRHCRQHGNIRMNGPFTCKDCHLPFPDQKSLREHYKIHIKDNSVVVKQEQKIEKTAHELESHQTFYVCVKCDRQYDNVDNYKKHQASHGNESTEDVDDKTNIVSVESESKKTNGIVSSKIVVKQAAESNTSVACPDSSWDNVPKEAATSVKQESKVETSEISDSNLTNSSENTNKKERDENSSPKLLTPQKSIESGSESEKKSDEGEIYYKHKKFFHHRKRASSTQSLSNDATDVKQAKASPEDSTSVADSAIASSSVSTVVNRSCDSTGLEDSKNMADSKIDADSKMVTDSKIVEEIEKEKAFETKSGEKTVEKPTKTEARHSLPFVWDRTTRSQKKL